MLSPAVRYAWYRILADHVRPKETSQNLTFSSVRAHHAGQYYCTAWNQLGYQSSIVATLAVLCESRMRSVFNLMIMAHFIYPANWNSQQGMTSPPSWAFSKNVTNLFWHLREILSQSIVVSNVSWYHSLSSPTHATQLPSVSHKQEKHN